MPQFLLVIFDDPTEWAKVSPAEVERVMATHHKMQADLQAEKKFVGCNRLTPTGAVTVSVRDGKHVVSDGPFTETKEIMGGYYLIDCASRDEAIAWAKRLPLAEKRSCVEVRQLWPE